MALQYAAVLCTFTVCFRGLVHDLQETFKSRRTVLELLHEVDERSDRVDEQADGNDECGIVTKGDLVIVQEQTAADQNDNVENIGNESR